jgi:F420H(2)-dependent quinone reductase
MTGRRDLFLKLATAVHRTLYRRTGGRLGGRLAGCPILLLTTTGRRTGKQRTTPLLYLADGDRLVLVASKGGDDRSPVWYRNLEANPEVKVQAGPHVRRMRAATASGADREELWPRVVRMYAPYDTYQSKTRRQIPLVILS